MSFAALPHERRVHERRGTTYEDRLRVATAVQDATGCRVGGSHMRRIVARYSHEVDASLWGFFDFFANALLMDARARTVAANDPDVRHIIEYADPTGETAVRHLMSGH